MIYKPLWFVNISSCGCGRLRDKHSVDAQRPHTDDAEWEASKHTKEDGFTDAFGQIEFRGGGPASRAKVIDALTKLRSYGWNDMTSSCCVSSIDLHKTGFPFKLEYKFCYRG